MTIILATTRLELKTTRKKPLDPKFLPLDHLPDGLTKHIFEF
jgi:hypothetical protein